MPRITFIQPDGTEKTVNAPENHSLMQIALQNDIEGIEGICGGAMACATCHCYIASEWVERVEAADNEKTEEEEDILDMSPDIRENSRLACQIKITKELNELVAKIPSTQP